MPKMYTQRTKQTALFSVLFTIVFLFIQLNSFANDIEVSFVKKNYNGSDVSCYGANDAQLTITAKGGSAPYMYSIDNGKKYQSSNVFPNLEGSKNYVVIVKDTKGRTSDAKWIWISTVYNPVTISSAYASNTSCPTSNDGEFSFTAFGGTGKLVFSIDNGATWQSETRFVNLAAGTYQLIARDLNGCTSDYKTIRIESGKGIIAVIDYKEDYYCNWGDGSVTVRGANGKSPYRYSIDGLPYVSNGVFSNLAPGQHTVVVVDSKGCTSSVVFEIKAALYASLSGDTTITTGGTASLLLNIDEGSARRTGYTLILKDSDGKTYTYPNLKSGANIITIDNLKVSTTFSISKLTSAAGCTAYTNGSAAIKVEAEKRSIWLGINSNWNDKINWNDGKIPASNSIVLIDKKANNPLISEEAYAQNIVMQTGATLQVSGKLILTGSITGAPESVDLLSGTIEFSGTEKQELNGSMLIGKGIKNLIINNDLVLQDSLNVFGFIKFNVAKKNLYTNDLLTLKSTAKGTAVVGNLTENNILGKVTVENFIPAKKGWKLLAIPTEAGQSIHDAWQEGQADSKVGVPGKGIQIPGEMSNWKEKGFDSRSYAPSLKTYNAFTNTWVGIKSTYDSFTDTSNAYMVFVRGDRASSGLNSQETETTLRTRGELKSGEQRVYDIIPGKFVPVGNPYAAALDLKKINTSKNMFYYFWDPELGTNYGAYQTVRVNKNGTYKVIPGSKTMTKEKVFVESGQAFFVFSKNGGTLQIDENSKADIREGKDDRRPAGNAGDETEDDELEVKLYAVNNGAYTLLDGVLQSFNAAYSKAYDEYDALKSSNTGESLSIKSDNKAMSMESRPAIENTDTTHLNLTGVKLQAYRFEISLMQQPNGMEALLIDRFTNQSTPILVGSPVYYEFTVSATAASYATNRFMIVFRPMKPMPVTFKGIKAEKTGQQVQVSWKVDNEVNVNQFIVEKSSDGTSFSSIGNVNATQLNSYSYNDVNPASGVNYYRVLSVDVDGKKGYSEIVKVVFNNGNNTSLNVYPNPVTGNSVNLQLNIKSKGIYYISIKNQIGQVIDTRKVNLTGNSQSLEIKPAAKLASGVYTIEVTHPNGEQSTVRFVK